MRVTRTRPESQPGYPDRFTGTVWIDQIAVGTTPSRLRSNSVHFTPGARTAWHTHPAGQTLYILHGTGRVQSWGGKVREVRPGDVVWFPPGEKHWHGAGPATMMTHLAITEVLNGKFVEWLEPVTDEQHKASAG